MNVGSIIGKIRIWYHFGLLVHSTILYISSIHSTVHCSGSWDWYVGIGRNQCKFCG